MRIGKVIVHFLWIAFLVIRPIFGQDLPTIEELRQRLKDWRQDLVVFRIRYEEGEVEGNWGGKRFREFIMTDSHGYLDSEEWFWPDKSPTKKVSGGNANGRFIANYVSPDDGKSWKLSSVQEIRRSNSRVGSALQVTPLAVLLEPHSGLWMDEYYFSENDVKVTAREDVEGETCIVLDVTYMRDGEIDGNGSRVWLAENKDFLIKKLMPNDGRPTGRRDAEFLCTEFKLAGDKWYPSQGTLLLPPEQSFWKVVAFEVNPKINARLFQVPSTKGLVARSLQQPGTTATSSDGIAATPDATPRDNKVLFLSGLGLLVFVLGLSLWWKLNRSH